MAHFAELKQKTDPTGFTTDLHWVVERVIVVDNSHVSADEALDGENWCSTFFGGGTWKQTSYNSNFRKQYAGKGYIFDTAKNKFLTPQPFASWSLDENDDWQAPVTYPTDITDKRISSDEACQKCTAKDSEDNNYNWDASALAWVSA